MTELALEKVFEYYDPLLEELRLVNEFNRGKIHSNDKCDMYDMCYESPKYIVPTTYFRLYQSIKACEYHKMRFMVPIHKILCDNKQCFQRAVYYKKTDPNMIVKYCFKHYRNHTVEYVRFPNLYTVNDVFKFHADQFEN